jgi:hypothetical protein
VRESGEVDFDRARRGTDGDPALIRPGRAVITHTVSARAFLDVVGDEEHRW